ncbi:MAG TPA: hypothetical protein VK843_17085 [Planctomycetota bacterium]|nr:hypothetical protein [Planctomycetota bacterium]
MGKTNENGRRNRRGAEELIAELQEKIRLIEARAAAKQAKESPATSLALLVVRKLDKATTLAEEEEDTSLRHVLSDARKPLAAYLESRGLQLPKGRTPRGRRPRAVSSNGN